MVYTYLFLCHHVYQGIQGDDITVLAVGVSTAIAVTCILICIPLLMTVVFFKYRRSKRVKLLGLYCHR